MSDIPEPLADSPEGTQTRVESTKWDIGNAALPTTVTTNRFDIVSNGSLTIEPMLPIENSQHNAGSPTISGERKSDSNLQPNIAAISQGSSYESGPNKGLHENIPPAIKVDSKNDSTGGPQTISGERKYESPPQPKIAGISQGSSYESGPNKGLQENLPPVIKADSRNDNIGGPQTISSERKFDPIPQPNIAGISQGSSYESGPNKGPINIPSPRSESSDRISATLENSFVRTEIGSDPTVAGLTPKLTHDTKYSQRNAESDLVTAKITLAKTAIDTLPAFELVKTEKPSEKSAEPIPEITPRKAFDFDTRVQTQGERILAKMGSAVESTLGKNKTSNTGLDSPLILASNMRVEENMGLIRISSIEGHNPSLNFRAFIRSASELLAMRSLQSHREFRIENLVRPVELDPASNIRKLEIARHINSKGTLPATFNIRGPESIRTATLSTVESSLNLSISDRRTSLLIGQVKDALANPAANFNTTTRGDTLSAQGILRSQFTTARGDGLTPISFTVKDARANMNVGDPRYPGYLEIGRRKKKKKNGEEDDECATNLSPESCRYISGLELGLLIALAGIAKQEGPDRTNRKVVKENQINNPSSSLKMDIHQSRDFISNAIQQNKIEKCLSSKHRDNQYKSSSKFKLKNLLRKLKEKMKELSDKEFKKLESSDTKEELLDRLSKIVSKDEKRLFSKRQLSSFNSEHKENLSQKTHPAASLKSQIVSYRPLWLVTLNDTLTTLAEQIYQDPDVGWLIADMNITRIKESYVNGKRVIELQSRQQIELPIQEDIDLFKMNKPKEAIAERLITIVQTNQLDKELINSQLQALQIKRKAIGTT